MFASVSYRTAIIAIGVLLLVVFGVFGATMIRAQSDPVPAPATVNQPAGGGGFKVT